MVRNIVISEMTLHSYENAIVDFVLGDGTSLQSAGVERFRNLVNALTNGYRPPSARTLLKRGMELYYILNSKMISFLSNLSVEILLNIDNWSARNFKEFLVVTGR